MSLRDHFVSVGNDLQADAYADIQCVREQLATLWWHAEAAYRPQPGVTVDGARLEMARASCEIGITLNQLGDKLRLTYENLETATKGGAP